MNLLQLFKKAPWRKIALGLVFLLVLLVTLVVLTGAWFSNQGRREWAETKRELLRQGEVLSYEDVIPSPVPSDKNFFADPVWVPDADGKLSLFAFQISPEEAAQLTARFPEAAEALKESDRHKVIMTISRKAKDRSITPDEAALVLAVLEPVTGDLDTLRKLAMRPEARFPLEYQKGVAMPMPHLTAILKAAQMLQRRANAEAVLRQTDESVQDILLILRLAHVVDSDPLVISFLVSISVDSIALDTIEKQLPTWNVKQASQIAESLSHVDLLRQMTKTFRGERAFGNQFIDKLRQASWGKFRETLSLLNGLSGGEQDSFLLAIFGAGYRFAFLDGDQSFLNKTHQQWLDWAEKEPGTLRPLAFANLDSDITREMQGLNRCRHILTYMAIPAIKEVFVKAASIETRVRQARIACAIQEYALSERALPSSLDQLVPKYLDEMPRDVINGGPMHYRSDGKEYVLWSVGWNEKDDDGEASLNEKSPEKKLDWVWKGHLPETFAVP